MTARDVLDERVTQATASVSRKPSSRDALNSRLITVYVHSNPLFSMTILKGQCFDIGLQSEWNPQWLNIFSHVKRRMISCQEPCTKFNVKNKRKLLTIFEPTCAYARWAHMHRNLSVCLSVTWPKFRLEKKSLDKKSCRKDMACLYVTWHCRCTSVQAEP